MASKVYQVNDEQFREIVASSNTYSDCLRALGLGTKGGSSTDILKRRISELNFSIDHFGRRGSGYQAKHALIDILVENSTYANISSLKRRLVREGVLEYKCAVCGINEWLGQEISLQLDHINGVNNDHRAENLRFLCPNCHSQTDTYGGRNVNK